MPGASAPCSPVSQVEAATLSFLSSSISWAGLPFAALLPLLPFMKDGSSRSGPASLVRVGAIARRVSSEREARDSASRRRGGG